MQCTICGKDKTYATLEINALLASKRESHAICLDCLAKIRDYIHLMGKEENK